MFNSELSKGLTESSTFLYAILVVHCGSRESRLRGIFGPVGVGVGEIEVVGTGLIGFDGSDVGVGLGVTEGTCGEIRIPILHFELFLNFLQVYALPPEITIRPILEQALPALGVSAAEMGTCEVTKATSTNIARNFTPTV